METDAAPSRADVEAVVLRIASEILECEVAPSSNFFSLGGDSLGAVEFSASISAVYGYDLPIELAFASPSLEAYASTVTSLLRELSIDDDMLGVSNSSMSTLEPRTDAALMKKSRV